MNNYYAGNDYNFHSIKAILLSHSELNKTKIKKLILLLNKKEARMHNVDNKIKDNQKNLRKYHGKKKVTSNITK